MGTCPVTNSRRAAENSSEFRLSNAKMTNELTSYAVRKKFPASDEPAFSNRDILDGARHSPDRVLKLLQVVGHLMLFT